MSDLQHDIEARQSALHPETSFIVQAPAGSGKTELLIQRFLCLLGRVEDPEEVLAITFTNKAAAEMRHRVVSALSDALSDEEPDAEHLQLTRRLARIVLQRDREKRWNLSSNAGRLRIQTLDSFNAMLARMEPLTASVSTIGTNIPGDADLRQLYREAAASTLDYLDGPENWAETVSLVLSHMDCNVAMYVERLAEMLVARDQWLPLIGGARLSDEESGEVRAALERDLEAMVNDNLESVRQSISDECIPELLDIAAYAARTLLDAGRDSGINELHGIEALPEARWQQLPAWRAMAELLLTGDGKPRSRLSIAQGFPPGDGDGKAMKARHKDLSDALLRDPETLPLLQGLRVLPEPRYPDEQWRVLRALLDLLKLATGELKRLFRARGATDYTEVSLGAAAALGDEDKPTDLGLLLDYRISHILVDEVQDTSLAQYRMLERLVAGWSNEDGRTLFCVGDPMQSIYRFRNAEVAQFLVAREQGIGEQPLRSLTLQQNFRSGDGLVDWFNMTFKDVMPAVDEPQRGAVSYATAVSPLERRGYGKIGMHPVLGSDEVHEAETSCQVIADLLEQNPGEQVAVLVRGRTQLRELVPALRRRGIDFSAVDIDTLTELPEIIDLLCLTRAIAHSGDRHAWLGVLRAPWIGLDFSDLVELVKGDRRSTVIELLDDEDRLAMLSATGRTAIDRVRSSLRLMRRVIRTGSLRERVEQVWMNLGGPVWLDGESAADNVNHFFSVLADIESNGTLPDIATLESQLDAEKVSSVSATARVEIMTMHKSKGLQFDHVVLHGLGRTTRGDTSRVLNWLESTSRDGEDRLLLAPVGRSDSHERDPIHAFLALLNKEKSRFELQRLLYVACTRARKSLQLVGHVGVDRDSGEMRDPATGSLLNLLWPIVADEFRSADIRGDIVSQALSEVEWLQPELRRLPKEWSPPTVDYSHLLGERGRIEAERHSYEWVGSDAKTAGTLVHRWLQAWTDGKLQHCRRDPTARDEVTRRWLRDTRYQSAEHVIARVNRALDGVQSDERGQWLLDGEGHAELALTGVVDGDVVTGVIDRVRVDGNAHWIVDYKTSSHEGGNRAHFLDEEARRYREQLARYVSLYEGWTGTRPRAALYFPLMAEFVELDDL